MPSTLIRTKLNCPRLRRDVISRPVLVERLNEELDRSLTLIIAPAGFGKTTLLTEWVNQAPHRVAWLSLDESDNDLVVLVDYFIAAIRQLYPDACPDTLAMIHAAIVPKPEALVSALINEIDDLPERFTLVVDDYQFLTEPAIHQLFDLLLRHPPLQLHLLLSSRSDPPLALPRLRANRELNELRAADLRFTPQETSEFLAQAVGIEASTSLPDDSLERFEGWVAGLQLAALSLRSGHRAPVLDQDLTLRVRSRHIMDYFFEQVWQRQRPDVQNILMKTSILDRLSTDLAQAVLAEDDIPSTTVDLAALENAGLFLNAMDDTGEWFHCHALFREMLSNTLHKTCSPNEIVGLHLRASHWLSQNQLIDDALRHAVMAGAAELADQILAEHFVERLNHDDWHAFERWLKILPESWIDNQPWCLVAKAYVANFKSQWNEATVLLKQAVQQLESADCRVDLLDRPVLIGYAQALWSQYWIAVNEAAEARKAAQQAIDTLPRKHIFARGLAMVYRTQAVHALDDLSTAEHYLTQALVTEAPSNAGHVAARLMVSSVSLYLAEGDVPQIVRAAETLRQSAADANLPVSLGWAHMALGVAAYEANDLDRAAEHFAANVTPDYAGSLRAVHECLVGLALVESARGQRELAQRAVTQLLDLQRELRDPWLAAESDSLLVRLALREGNLTTAWRASSHTSQDFALLWYLWLEVPAITHIRVELARQARPDLERTQAELDALLELATRLHKPRRMVELLSLKALLFDQLNQRDEALSVLEAAMALGKPRGLVRAIADVGSPLLPLLKAIAGRTPSNYLDRVMGAIQLPDNSRALSPGFKHTSQALPVSLTYREQDVLDLLGQRYSDREIATALVISPLTVRSHIENLSEKLGVRGRRRLVIRAREVGLLPT